METRNYESGAAASPPTAPVTPSIGYPTNGDPLTPTPATMPGAFWFFKIGEALRSIITGCGFTPSDDDLLQLAKSIQSGGLNIALAAGTSDAIIATFGQPVLALKNGMALYVKASAANDTTTPTFTPNAGVVAAKVIVKGAGQALAVADIAGAGHWIELRYDSGIDKWVLINPATGVTQVAVGNSSFRGLLGYIGTTNTTYAVTAPDAIVVDSDGIGHRLTSLNLNSLDLTLAQAGSVINGRDQSSTFGAGLIFCYVVWGNGHSAGLLFSGSETNPVLPTGYTHKAIVGPLYWSGTSFSVAYRYYNNACYIDTAPLVLSNGTGTAETQVNTSTYISALVSYVIYKISGTMTSDSLNRKVIDTQLRHISGVDFMHLSAPTYDYATSSAGMPSVTGVQILIPNAGQKLFYLQTVTLGSAPLLSIGIAGFVYPNGAN